MEDVNRSVHMMLKLHKDLPKARNGPDRTAIGRPPFGRAGQIAATDKQIDQSVHELYGLTEAETSVVERELEGQ